MKRSIVLILVVTLLLSLAATANADVYVVETGDVLWKIAKENNTTVETLVELNDLKDGNMIYVNQELQLTAVETVELSNKEKAVAVIESIGTDNLQPVSYINPNKYIVFLDRITC